MEINVTVIEPPKNGAFSAHVKDLQLAWDSTSLSLLKSCPRKYYLRMIQNWTPKHTSVHLRFGIWYHQTIERYHIERAQQKSHDEAYHTAITQLLQSATEEIKDSEGEVIGSRLWPEELKTKSIETLVRTAGWYLETFKDDPAETMVLSSGDAAVELSFRFPLDLDCPDDKGFLLCGHLDRVARFQNQLWVFDYKTTGKSLNEYYFNQFNPNNQMSLYTLAGKVITQEPVSGVIIDAAQIAKSFSRFQRWPVRRTETQLNVWLTDTMWWILQAAAYARNQHWPMNDMSCMQWGACDYRQVCKEDPAVMVNVLKTGYKQEMWDPLEVR